MTEEPKQTDKRASQQPAPASAPPKPVKKGPLGGWSPSKTQIIAAAIAAIAVSNVGTWLYVAKRNTGPEFMMVGVREMTQQYMAGLATANITPEEAGIRMDLYMSVTQDTLNRATRGKNIMLLARECVLGGPAEDVTGAVGEAVKSAMDKALTDRGLSATTSPLSRPAAPGVLGQPQIPSSAPPAPKAPAMPGG